MRTARTHALIRGIAREARRDAVRRELRGAGVGSAQWLRARHAVCLTGETEAVLRRMARTLSGCCWSLSRDLYRRLRAAGFAPSLRHGTFDAKCHYWLELDGAILDVTATQFGRYPAVWFPADPAHYRPRCRECAMTRVPGR